MHDAYSIDLANKFEELAREWDRHCRSVALSSTISAYLNSDAYRALVALGRPALPLIIERYRHDTLPWEFVLDDITGLRMIENRSRYSPREVKVRWLDWWERSRANP